MSERYYRIIAAEKQERQSQTKVSEDFVFNKCLCYTSGPAKVGERSKKKYTPQQREELLRLFDTRTGSIHEFAIQHKVSLCAPLSRFLRDNLSRIFTKPLKTLDEKYFRPVPNALRTFFWRSPNHPKTPFFTLFDRHRRSSATAPPRAPVRSRDRDVPVVRLRTRAGPSVCRRQSASSAVR